MELIKSVDNYAGNVKYYLLGEDDKNYCNYSIENNLLLCESHDKSQCGTASKHFLELRILDAKKFDEAIIKLAKQLTGEAINKESIEKDLISDIKEKDSEFRIDSLKALLKSAIEKI